MTCWMEGVVSWDVLWSFVIEVFFNGVMVLEVVKFGNEGEI